MNDLCRVSGLVFLKCSNNYTNHFTSLFSALFKGCNISMSTERLDRVHQLCVYFVNGSRYDFNFILHGILTHLCNYQIQYTRENGTTYTRNLLADEPRTLFKDKSTPLSISIKFQCPLENCSCTYTQEQKLTFMKNNIPIQPCFYKKRILFKDSLMLIAQPLDKLITSAHEAANKEKIPIAKVFASSKLFCDKKGYSEELFKTFISCKIPCPYELAKSYEFMKNFTQMPQKHHFASILRDTHAASDEQYQIFAKMWTDLGITNLLEFFIIYNIR